MTMMKHLGALLVSVVTPMELSNVGTLQAQWRIDVPTSVVPENRLVSNRLKVVEVAPAPEIQGQKLLAEPVTQRTCPFYLHAVIESDVASESFALIQLDGEPEIIREGGIVRRGSTRFKVRRIARQKLVLRQGKQEVQCFLSNEESSQ